MTTRNTRSAFTDDQGNNATKTALSTNIIIKARGFIVGAIQTMDIDEERSVEMIDEVGTDGHIDSAPIKSTDISGSCERVRFQRLRVSEAFGCPFVHVASQRIPFDIEIHDTFHDNDTNNRIITVLKNVWITKISYKFDAKNWIIADNMSFEGESIASLLANNNVVTGVANGQSGTIVRNQYEQEADRGKYRGAMDAPGVMNAFLTDPTS